LGGALKVKVRAPAEKGRANRSVEALLAKKLGLGKGQVTVISGHTSEMKVVEVGSIAETELLQLLPPV
jgi:uncharacterized protein